MRLKTPAAMPAQSDDVPTIGDYEILGEIGRGGMAVVLRGRQVGLRRDVAIKRLEAKYLEDASMAQRFLRESRLEGSLNHPNIVTVHDFSRHEGVPFIVMEYLSAGSLRPYLPRLTLPQLAGVMECVLAGLSRAHADRIVHRDLKPENLLVAGDGRVKIADFGIAKALDQIGGGHLRTATGMTVGTPAYMAPEQARGEPLGPFTDLYACGVIAYEVLVGRLPYPNSGSPQSMLLRSLREPLPAPRAIRPDLDPRLAGWLEWMLAKDPARRPSCADAAWAVLEDIVIALEGPLWRRRALLAQDSGPMGPAPAAAKVKTTPSLHTPASPEPDDRAPSETPPPTTVPARIVTAGPSAPRRGRAAKLALAAAVVAVVAALALAIASQMGHSGASGRRPAPVPEQSTSIPVGRQPGAVAADEAAIWVAGFGDGSVTRVDARTQRAGAAVSVGRGPVGIALAGDDAWVINRMSRTLVRLDGRTGQVEQTVAIPGEPLALAADAKRIWVACADGDVWPVGLRSGRVADRPVHVDGRPSAVAASRTALWIADFDRARLLRIDPRTGAVQAEHAVGREPWAIALDGRFVWVAGFADQTVTRLDVDGAEPETTAIPLDEHPVALLADDEGVWVTATERADRAGDGSLLRIGRSAEQPVPVAQVPSAFGLGGARGALWLSDWQHGLLRRHDAAQLHRDEITNRKETR